MRRLLIICFAFMVSIAGAQTRKNMLYAGFGTGLVVGLDHAFQLTKRQYTSGRIYFVVSPNLMRSGYGYGFSADDEAVYPKSKFETYYAVLPLLLRFELSPNRIVLGKSPGKHDSDAALFFDVGISLNYLLSAHLHEDFTQTAGGTFPFVFDGPITSSASTRLSAEYTIISFGFRINRVTLFLRAYQPFVETTYTNLSKGWGMPPGVKSFFFDKWTVDPFYKQGTVTLCLAYSL